MKTAVVSLIVIFILGCTHTPELSEPSRLVGRTQYHMGTSIEVRVPQDQLAVSEKAFQVFADLDARLSTYKPDSEISRLNAGKDVKLSEDTLEVLRLSETMKLRSSGYFDIQLGKRNGPRDLGGIGKGFAVDKARDILQKSGIRRGLIAASGDIYCFDPCHVAVRDPLGGALPLIEGTLNTGGWAITTSGRDLRDHIKTPGKKAFPKHWVSITLMSKLASNAELDAWATAFFAMPEDKALEKIDSLEGMGYFIVTSDLKIKYNSLWFKAFHKTSRN